jgi:hypothetical protein
LKNASVDFMKIDFDFKVSFFLVFYIKKTGQYKLEYQNSKPKTINGKFVVLI